jgi:hypothetical protein
MNCTMVKQVMGTAVTDELCKYGQRIYFYSCVCFIDSYAKNYMLPKVPNLGRLKHLLKETKMHVNFP